MGAIFSCADGDTPDASAVLDALRERYRKTIDEYVRAIHHQGMGRGFLGEFMEIEPTANRWQIARRPDGVCFAMMDPEYIVARLEARGFTVTDRRVYEDATRWIAFDVSGARKLAGHVEGIL